MTMPTQFDKSTSLLSSSSRFLLLCMIGMIVLGCLVPMITACESDAECSPPTPRCHVDDATCVECLGDADCETRDDGFTVCNLETFTCEEPDLGPQCQNDEDCQQAHPDTPYCKIDDKDSSNNLCVECLNDDNCSDHADTDGKTVCSTAYDNKCVVPDHCTVDTDCSDTSGKPYCKVITTDPSTNHCVECLTSEHCEDKTDTPVCNPETNTCNQVGMIPISRLDIKFSRYPNHTKKDPKFDTIVSRVATAAAETKNCVIRDVEDFITVAKRTWGYYLIGDDCTEENAKYIENFANVEDTTDDGTAADDDDDNLSDDENTETKDVSVSVSVSQVKDNYPEMCVDTTTHEVQCVISDAACTLPCGNGTPCTKDNEKTVCGSYQKCKIEDEQTTGVCNHASGWNMMASSVQLIVLTITMMLMVGMIVS